MIGASGREIVRQADAAGRDRVEAGDTPTRLFRHWNDDRLRFMYDADDN